MKRVLRPASCVLGPLRRIARFFTQDAAHRTQHLVISAVLILLAPSAFACPVCFGSPDDPLVEGTNKGIWVLLGLVGFVQIGFGAMFYSFWRRARDQKKFRDQFHVIDGGPLT